MQASVVYLITDQEFSNLQAQNMNVLFKLKVEKNSILVSAITLLACGLGIKNMTLSESEVLKSSILASSSSLLTYKLKIICARKLETSMQLKNQNH